MAVLELLARAARTRFVASNLAPAFRIAGGPFLRVGAGHRGQDASRAGGRIAADHLADQRALPIARQPDRRRRPDLQGNAFAPLVAAIDGTAIVTG